MASYLLYQLMLRMPLFCVLLVGIVLAIIHWKQHPLVSACTIVGLILLAFSTFYLVSQPYLGRLLLGNGQGSTMRADVLVFLSRVMPFLETGAWILILIAIFRDRKAVLKPEQTS